MRWGLKPRAVTVDGVGDEYAGAHDAKERGDCFQHATILKAQRMDLTACGDTQSKEFLSTLNFANRLMF